MGRFLHFPQLLGFYFCNKKKKVGFVTIQDQYYIVLQKNIVLFIQGILIKY